MFVLAKLIVVFNWTKESFQLFFGEVILIIFFVGASFTDTVITIYLVWTLILLFDNFIVNFLNLCILLSHDCVCTFFFLHWRWTWGFCYCSFSLHSVRLIFCLFSLFSCSLWRQHAFDILTYSFSDAKTHINPLIQQKRHTYKQLFVMIKPVWSFNRVR